MDHHFHHVFYMNLTNLTSRLIHTKLARKFVNVITDNRIRNDVLCFLNEHEDRH